MRIVLLFAYRQLARLWNGKLQGMYHCIEIVGLETKLLWYQYLTIVSVGFWFHLGTG
jgi:hypothetical protein